jgi:hypothetical protein
LKLAHGSSYVVELGTAMGWTAISLALTDSQRQVATYDPFERPELARYLDLVPPDVRNRVTPIFAPGDEGPQSDRPVDLLYIDTTHECDATIREIEAWRPVLGDGAFVVLDDYAHPDFPGVRQAVDRLQLNGAERAGLFVHRTKGSSLQPLPFNAR